MENGKDSEDSEDGEDGEDGDTLALSDNSSADEDSENTSNDEDFDDNTLEKDEQKDTDNENDDKGGNSGKKGRNKNSKNHQAETASSPSNEAGKQGGGGSAKEISDDENEYNFESIIKQLKSKNNELSKKYTQELKQTQKSVMEEMVEPIDDHSFWRGDDEYNTKRAEWENHIMKCTEITMEKEDGHKAFGGPPLCAQRKFKELTHPEIDWRTVLNEFVQEEINDYSFSPPDRRMDDSPFFLPDFNEKDEKVKNVWFLIDTSGSIGDKQIAAAYSEIINAINMFNGHLEGKLSFTEVFVTDPIPFCDVDELLAIKPVGGGGNNFSAIFHYMQDNMLDDLPTSIIIMTDGYDRYPNEKLALGIPVFWLLNNQDAEPPPWGRWARFKVNDSVPKSVRRSRYN